MDGQRAKGVAPLARSAPSASLFASPIFARRLALVVFVLLIAFGRLSHLEILVVKAVVCQIDPAFVKRVVLSLSQGFPDLHGEDAVTWKIGVPRLTDLETHLALLDLEHLGPKEHGAAELF